MMFNRSCSDGLFLCSHNETFSCFLQISFFQPAASFLIPKLSVPEKYVLCMFLFSKFSFLVPVHFKFFCSSDIKSSFSLYSFHYFLITFCRLRIQAVLLIKTQSSTLISCRPPSLSSLDEQSINIAFSMEHPV